MPGRVSGAGVDPVPWCDRARSAADDGVTMPDGTGHRRVSVPAPAPGTTAGAPTLEMIMVPQSTSMPDLKSPPVMRHTSRVALSGVALLRGPDRVGAARVWWIELISSRYCDGGQPAAIRAPPTMLRSDERDRSTSIRQIPGRMPEVRATRPTTWTGDPGQMNSGGGPGPSGPARVRAVPGVRASVSARRAVPAGPVRQTSDQHH